MNTHVRWIPGLVALAGALAMAALPGVGPQSHGSRPERALAPAASAGARRHAGGHTLATAQPKRAWMAEAERRIALAEYRPSMAAGGLQAPNRAQGLRARFAPGALALEPRQDAAAWSLTWRTTSWGRAGRERPCALVAPRLDGERVRYDRPGLAEWYDNGPRGLEQGFSIAARPEGAGPLVITGSLGGSLAPRLSSAPRAGGAAGAVAFAVPAARGGGAASLRYAGLVARDARGRTLPARLRAASGAVVIEIDDARAVYPLDVDPTFTLLNGVTYYGSQDGERFGAALSTAGDVNGDGYADLLVGAPGYDGNFSGEGAVFLFLGSPAGLALSPSWTGLGGQGGSLFGSALCPAGDVDGDGYDDFLVGAPGRTGSFTHEGRASLFRGSPTGPSTLPSWTFDGGQANAHFGAALAGAGRLFGDSTLYVAVGAPDYDSLLVDRGRVVVFRGAPGGLAASPSWVLNGGQAGAHFGAALAGFGDANADGVADLAVGAPSWNNGAGAAGAVFLYTGWYTGPSVVPATSLFGSAPGESFGSAIAFAGDVYADQHCDLLVGASNASSGFNLNGRVSLYRGDTFGLVTAPAWTTVGDQDSAFYGAAVATAGDVDGDGYADVLVGAPGENTTGRDIGEIYLFLGSATGLPTQPSETAQGTSQTGVSEPHFGAAVATAGDVNGDGFSDVVASEPDEDEVPCEPCPTLVDEGNAVLYYGHAGAPARLAQRAVESNQAQAQLGFAIASAHDVNGDGYSDVLVGAPRYDGGLVDEGRVFLFLGGDSGLAATPAWTADGGQAGARFGTSVAWAGDVNGDGYADLAVGAPRYDGLHTDEGRAFVFLGKANAASISTVPAWQYGGDRDSAQVGASVAGLGDLNGDGLDDLAVGAPGFKQSGSNQGKFDVFVDSDTGLVAGPAFEAVGPSAGYGLGTVVARAWNVRSSRLRSLLVGTNGFGARVYYGASGGNSPVDSAYWSVANPQPGSGFGSAVAGAGDVNGDGFSDVLIGAPNYTGTSGANAGRVFLYAGGAGGLSTSALQFLEVTDVGAHFGSALASAGDLDGDGFGDVVVGAPTVNTGHGGLSGEVYAFTGSPTGLAPFPFWTAAGVVAGEQFGAAVAGQLDVNGDGFSDILVGAPGYANGQAGEGRWVAYLGNRGSGVAMRPRVTLPGGGIAARKGPATEASGFGIVVRDHIAWGQVPGGIHGGLCGGDSCVAICGAGCSPPPKNNTGTSNGDTTVTIVFNPQPGGYGMGVLLTSICPYLAHSRLFTSPNATRHETAFSVPGSDNTGAWGGLPVRPALAVRSAPNPFRGGTRLSVALPRAGRVRVDVFDVAGRHVAGLFAGAHEAGELALAWDGRRDDGASARPGVYFAVVRIDGVRTSTRLVRLGP